MDARAFVSASASYQARGTTGKPDCGVGVILPWPRRDVGRIVAKADMYCTAPEFPYTQIRLKLQRKKSGTDVWVTKSFSNVSPPDSDLNISWRRHRAAATWASIGAQRSTCTAGMPRTRGRCSMGTGTVRSGTSKTSNDAGRQKPVRLLSGPAAPPDSTTHRRGRGGGTWRRSVHDVPT